MAMRRSRSAGAGGTLYAQRTNAADSLSLIRSFDSETISTRPIRPSPLAASTFHGLPLDLLDRLRSFPLFLSAPDSFLAAIGSHLRPQLHNAHDYILTEGDDAKAMYWLVRGALSVTSRDGESTYAELKPGAFFGEIGILMDIPRTATIVAKLKSLVVRLNKEDLQKVLPSYPDVERVIRDEATERLTILERRKKELSASKTTNSGSTGGGTGSGSDNSRRNSTIIAAAAAAAAAVAAAAAAKTSTSSTTTMTTAKPPENFSSAPFSPTSTSHSTITIPTRNAKRPPSVDGDVLMAETAGLLKHRHGEILVSSSKKRKSPSPGLAETLASSALGSGSINVRQLLTELPLFASLPPDILHFIGLNAQQRSYPPFTDIIKQGSTGRDVFFIIRGEVEVVSGKRIDAQQAVLLTPAASPVESIVKARLRPGQYFGEVTSLALAPRRTATVRSVSAVEALMIGGDVLDELWQKCGPDLRRQVERTARDRLRAAGDADVHMQDADSTPAIGELEIDDSRPLSPNSIVPISFTTSVSGTSLSDSVEAVDPDPYLNVDLENVRSRSRRGSLAPPSPSTAAPPPVDGPQQSSGDSPEKSPLSNGHSYSHSHGTTLSSFKFKFEPLSPRKILANKRARVARRKDNSTVGILPDTVLARVFRHLDVYELMRLRTVSLHWMKLLTTSPDILHVLDLTPYNRHIDDHILASVICPFVGNRPKFIDISNCFHLTDEGFAALSSTCAANVKIWKMKSVWDITGQAVLDMTNRAKDLEEIDLSNCRKVGDNLLARVVGWTVPELSPAEQLAQQQRQQQLNNSLRRTGTALKSPTQQSPSPTIPQQPPPGTVIGCPSLKRLTLSYCKHITDRSMAHIATHASPRIEEMDLTRCTTITDQGFYHWSVWNFPRLTKLCLADCTYLTDNAIVNLTHSCRGLKWLDLSFCCALSDIATEVLALGCPSLQHLNLAFCGSAVSDSSLRVIGRHLLDLRELSVRGCVRVTGVGVEAVVDGCNQLQAFDVSQCRNLIPWLESGGLQKVWGSGRPIKFGVVAGDDGGWGTVE